MQKYKELYAIFNSLFGYWKEHPLNKLVELSLTALRMELQKQYKKLTEEPQTEGTTEPPPPPPEEP
jgi:hypothetical protein